MSENTKGLENLVELRSLALLDDLVKARSRKGAAEALGVDRRTLAANLDSGKLTDQMREAVDRLLRLGDATVVAREEKRFEEISSRLNEIDRAVRKAVHRLSQVEERLGEMDVVTPEPLPDDAIVYGKAVALVDEWRRLRASHPATRNRPVRIEERMLELEIVLIDEFRLTLPPEKYPWDGLARADQVSWRRRALRDVRGRRVWQDVRSLVRRVLTLRLWLN